MTERQQAPESERALAARFRVGERAAFDEIVRRHRQTIYRVVYRLLGNHHDADEAAQQAFIRAWKSRHGTSGTSPLRR